MNIAIWEKTTDNFKIEIICFMGNAIKSNAICDPIESWNVRMQEIIICWKMGWYLLSLSI